MRSITPPICFRFSGFSPIAVDPAHDSWSWEAPRQICCGRPPSHLLEGSCTTSWAGSVSRRLESNGWNDCGFGADFLVPSSFLPRSFLARSERTSAEWRRGFIQTFLARDIPQFGIRIPSPTLYRFWSMLAHYHGQIWNSSEFASSFGVSDNTVRRYLDVLTATFVVRQLQPWYENLKKRQVRSPKVYFADSGLLHRLLDLQNRADVARHPKLGASWEGFALNCVIRRLRARREECFFWAAHAGAELDLLVVRGRVRLGFEFKRTDAPRKTRSMHTVLADLKLKRLDVVHAGEKTFPLEERIRAVALSRVLVDIKPLR